MKAITTFRAIPITITPTNVTFASIFEETPFTLQNTDQHVNLFEEYEIEMEIERDNNGKICTGKVLHIYELDNSVEPWQAWENWYREVNEI